MLEAYEVSQPASTFSQKGSTRGRYAGVNSQLKNVEDTMARHTAQIEVGGGELRCRSSRRCC